MLVGISVGCLMGCFWAPPPWRKTAPLKRPIKRSMMLEHFRPIQVPKWGASRPVLRAQAIGPGWAETGFLATSDFRICFLDEHVARAQPSTAGHNCKNTVRAEIITKLILKRAGPVILKTFLLEAIALRPIPGICPARGVKPENYWKR